MDVLGTKNLNSRSFRNLGDYTSIVQMMALSLNYQTRTTRMFVYKVTFKSEVEAKEGRNKRAC
jgi:hypothetical protein